MKILIVEDEAKTAAFLRKGLIENGFIVDVAKDGADGLFLAKTESYSLIILDVMLPIIDGWTIAKEVRSLTKHLPILFLTAKDAIEDRVKGLEIGADDYLVKPFAFSELLARVRSLLRRGQIPQIDNLEIADLHIDLIRHKAMRAGIHLDLTPKEFALLVLLAKRKGELLTRTMIAEQVWDMNFDSDSNVVDVAIRRLRNKVDYPFPIKLIQTVRGVGYMLEEKHD